MESKADLEKIIYDKMNEGNMAQIKLNDDSKNTKNIISSEEKELCIFLYTIFQYYVEKAIELMNSEELKNKEKAKKILISLIDNSYVNYFKSNKIIYACLNGILHFYLGLSIFNTDDQFESEAPLMRALDFFNSLPMVVKMRYINIYQEVYNNLGILFYNKGEIKKGLQFFGKAEQMYKVFNDLNGHNITNNFNTFMTNFSKDINNDSLSGGPPPENLEFFNFFIDGGLNRKSFEHNYTLTIFYYAQAFTKLGFRKKAIKYCSMTLKRQIDLNEYDLKDTIVNCINLSEFYTENQHFAQAEYVLIAASALLPEDETKKRRIRALVQMHLGKYFLERLKFAVRQTKEQIWISENEELYGIVNKRIVTFNNMNILWPKIEDIRDIEQAKLLFRLGNTQFKKASEYFLLDGFVTEHINISRDISQLYKNLSFFESDNNRIFAMIERRLGLLESLIKQINPKTFIVQWQELALELGEIYDEYFIRKFDSIRLNNKLTRKSIDDVNNLGEKALYYYVQLFKYLDDEMKKNSEVTIEDYSTLITLKLNGARISSKLSYQEKQKNVNCLTQALKLYEEVDRLFKSTNIVKQNPFLEEQNKLCQEMIQLLPVKIQKINS